MPTRSQAVSGAFRRRLCYVADAASIHTQRWAAHFAQAGWDVHVFSLRPAVLPGIMVHQLVPWWPGKAGYLTTLPRLAEMLRHLSPDIVHAHYVTSYGLLAALAGARPLIISMWGSDVLDFPKRSAPKAWLVRWVLGKADTVLATSKSLADEARWLCPPGTPVTITPFGVDMERFSPGEQTAAPLQIGAVANLVPEKGLDVLLAAFARLREQVPPRPVRLVIAGDGPEMVPLRAQAERLGIADSIDWLGHVAPENLPAVLRRFAVLAMPSRRESFGVVALEAAACGVPVVASAVGGLLETVASGKSGLHVAPGDPNALADALARLIGDDGLRQHFHRSARTWVEQPFSWAESTRRMTEVYDTVLASCPGSAR